MLLKYCCFSDKVIQTTFKTYIYIFNLHTSWSTIIKSPIPRKMCYQQQRGGGQGCLYSLHNL